MKKNNKGFTLIETLIVSAFLIGTLTYLFIQINNTKTNFDISFKYDEVNSTYNAKIIANYLNENGYKNLIKYTFNTGYIDITNSSLVSGDSNYYRKLIEKTKVKNILFTTEDMVMIKDKIKSSNYSEEFKRYITKKDSNSSLTRNYIILVEFQDNTFAKATVAENDKTLDNYLINNFITNGNFENSDISHISMTSPFEKSRNNTIKYDGEYSLKIIGTLVENDTYVYLQIKNNNIIQNHIYYASQMIYPKNVGNNNWNGEFDMYRVGGTISGYPEYGNIKLQKIESNKWTKLSFRYTSAVSYNYYFRLSYMHSLEENVSLEFYYDNLILIDLTEIFGTGNEPSKEWCDNNIIYNNNNLKIK